MASPCKWQWMDAEVIACILEFLVAIPAGPDAVPGPRGVRPVIHYRGVCRRWGHAVCTLTERWLHSVCSLTSPVDELGLGPACLSLMLRPPFRWDCQTRFDLRSVMVLGKDFSAEAHTLSLITDMILPQGVPVSTDDWSRLLELIPNLAGLTANPWQLATLIPLRTKPCCFDRILELKKVKLTRGNQLLLFYGDDYVKPIFGFPTGNGKATDRMSKLESLEVDSVTNVPRFLSHVANYLKRLTKLVMIGSSFSVGEVEQIFPSIGVKLVWLDVASCSIKGKGFLQLVAHSCPSLTLLDVSYVLLEFLFDGWEDIFLRCKNLTTLIAPSSDVNGLLHSCKLEVLDLCGRSSTKEVMESINSLPHLRSFSFTAHHLGLAESVGMPICDGFAGRCPGLVSLYLNRAQLSDEGLRELALCPQLAVIAFVNIAGISAEGLRLFLGVLGARLRALLLSQGNADDQLLQFLGDAKFEGLRQLELTKQRDVTENALLAFLRTSVAKRLVHLGLANLALSDLILHVVSTARLTKLRYLDVVSTAITDAGILPVICSCLSLTFLAVSSPRSAESGVNEVTDALIQALLDTPDSALHTGTLSVTGCPRISVDALRRLRRASPSIEIQSDFQPYDVAPDERKSIAAAEGAFKQWLQDGEKIDHACFGC